ncbi:MAG: hypothetical protein ACRC54_00185 [Fusobacteriaceae bacterium]
MKCVIIKTKKMNLDNLNLVELNLFDTIEVNGGELPYTENAVNLRNGGARDVVNFFAGLWNGLTGKE